MAATREFDREVLQLILIPVTLQQKDVLQSVWLSFVGGLDS